MSGAAKVVGKGLGAIVTGGTSLIPGSPTKRVGDVVGNALTLGTSGQKGLFPDASGSNSGGGYNAPQMGSEDPVQFLASTGGAPLLTNIALGANVDDALAGYFGKSGAEWQKYVSSLSPEQQSAITGLRTQLTQIQTNTDLRTKAVQNVVNDFPNIVHNTAAQNAGKAFDEASQKYMDMAMKGVAAKYAAGGQLSSGAMVEASARTGAEMGLKRLDYTTNVGEEDWKARYDEANALQSFQQKMLGQGSTQGFSAAQAYLQRKQQTGEANLGASTKTQGINADVDAANAKNSSNMMGAIGMLAGTAIAGPMGANIGGAVGRMAGSGAATGGANNNAELGTGYRTDAVA